MDYGLRLGQSRLRHLRREWRHRFHPNLEMSNQRLTMNAHHHFNYIELPSTDNTAMKAFYGKVFGWTFQDWGETYVAIHGAGVEGGFDQASDEVAKYYRDFLNQVKRA